jgi:riboflavin kinase / FMN adenylyltransferase
MQTIHLTSQTMSQWQNQSQQQVLAIGFFDGLHKGHLSVIQEAKRLARVYDKLISVYFNLSKGA